LYHGIFLYESTLHVPLIFSWPGRVPAGRRITQRVSLVDLYPSILRLAGCEGAQTPFAEDLSATIRGHRSFAPRECYAETEEPWWQYGWSPLTALIADDWKYIRAPEQELYNLAQDPKELTNRVTVFPGRLSDLSYGLDRLEEAVETHAVSGVSLSDEDARVLQSLGYGGGGSPPPRRDAARQLPDPKQMVPLLNKAMYAKSLLNDGRVRQALDLLKEAIAPDPNNVGFMFLYAQALEKAGYLEEAAVVLGKILHHGGYKVTRVTMLDSMTLLAKCLYGMGKTDAAARYMQDALTLDPESIVAMNGLAWIWATYPDATEQQRQQAVTLAEDAVDRTDHAHPSYLDTLSVSYAAAGQFGDALEAAQQALDLAMAQENHKLADDIRGRMRQFSKRRMPSTSVQGP
jgi:tetratricopeptide (TPR) repeat protein